MGLAIVSEDGNTALYRKPYSAFYRFREHILASLQKVHARIDKQRQTDGGGATAGGGEEAQSPTDRLVALENQSGRLFKAFDAFFNHSDCDGEWSTEECALVRDLLHIVDGMPLEEQKEKKNEGDLDEEDERSDMSPALRRFLNALAAGTPSEEEDLKMMLKGLDYCIEHHQKAIFC